MKNIFRKLLLNTMILTMSLFAPSFAQQVTTVPGKVVTDWVGNTFALRPPLPTANGDTTQYSSGSLVPDYVDAIWVDANDGTVFTESYYDENGRNGAIFRNDSMVGQTFFAKNQFVRNGDIVGDNNFIYVTTIINYGNWTITGFGVERFTHTGLYAGWKNSGADTGAGFTNSFFILNDTGNAPSMSRLAEDTNAKELYLLNGDVGVVSVWNLATLNQNIKTTFSLPNVQKMVSDNAGSLWAISGNQIKKYSNRGIYSGVSITTVKAPTNISLDASGNLYVFDDSTLQIHVFNNLATNPTENISKVFGTLGGIYSGISGQVAPNKLEPRCSGIGTDNKGNFYLAWGDVAPVAGTDIRSVTPSGSLNWEVLGQPFSGVPGFDPGTDGQNVYYQLYMDSIDYTKAPGKTWSYKSFTWNRYANINYPSGYVGSVYGYTIVRNLGGKKFVYGSASSQTSGGFYIKRLDGQTLTPVDSVLDNNAWGWYIELNGNIWKASNKIYRFRYGGLNVNNAPIYSAVDSYPVPNSIGGVQRIKYDSTDDALYLSGYNSAYPNSINEWGRVGRILIKYVGWLRGTPSVSWIDTLPLDNTVNGIAGASLKDLWVEGDYIFVVTCNSSPIELIYVYSTSTGKLVGIITPGAIVEGNINFTGTYGGLGWVDMVGGIQAYKRLNGEYEILVEDNVGNKNMFYHWCPSGTCNITTSIVENTKTVIKHPISINPKTGRVLINGKYDILGHRIP